MMKTDLSIKIGKLKLKNPVMVASGTFGYGKEYHRLTNITSLGAIVTKTITLKPRAGNKPPRIYETPSGLLNSIGLQNGGIKDFIEKKIPYLKKIGIPVIVSIGGNSPAEYAKLAKMLSKINTVSAIELNISCPNVDKFQVTSYRLQVKKQNSKTCPLQPAACKLLIAQDPKAAYEVVKAVRKVTKKTIITKLSPNVTDVTEIAKSACKAGTDVIAVVNTFLAMAIDIDTKKPVLGNVLGGLSGPAIKPIALRMVWQLYKEINVPIIGMGGIMNSDDAIEFMLAGASAVSTGTANFIDSNAAVETIKGIKKYLIKNKISNIKKIIGAGHECFKTL